MTEHLADGWEPGLETDTLLRAGTEVWLADAVHVAEAMGGRVEDRGSAVLVDNGYPSLFSAAAFLRGPVPADDVAAVLDWFPGVHAVISPVPTPDLTAIGLQLVGHPPFMVRPPGGAPPPSTAHAVTEVADAEGIAAFERCLVDGFPIEGGAPWAPGALFDERVLGGAGRFYVGRDDDGRVVATSGSYVQAGVVEVSYVSTLPEARGRGWGEAMTWAAATADPFLPAVLVASDPGRPIYERMGFLPVSRFTFWAGGL